MIEWLDDLSCNRFTKTYYNGFVDISGGDFYLRNNSQAYIQGGDISLNGRLITPQFTINENVHLKPSARLFNNPVFVIVPSLCTSEITTLIMLPGLYLKST